ncbi:MAG: hypothetical protein CGU28_13410 [Candidatus Dactylopiibacterium carminicum]|uniref:Heavy-metal-associated domain-containing protein n=1 Tax=Candidatus Dactylopiibacterium carminicum TaxID=857335 RepID=A0A272EQ87_9RHOO|nr:heavy-metal-associated domain-containing protein [Candidatus Dactylopiibacterium carminicum]KAF7598218.1 hypothetical protein BGI27_14485 [Candidatus Dactylopiibacterium carminicum]PAS91870.1 MAG: hypothetical protein CGU29_14105 [Candidatus Dactylopiibacterium carminicum]PAS94845.1 MAG: hypothetical protein CGU28_13410 [Candidatus Dactylopiibacterium carminicum]PAS97013.1 MAG: hypothetical protein BSR46_14520 [Candidatus Dactylopiibacterium carminicum]
MKELETFRRFAGSVQIAHHIPGRIRFKLGAIELDAEGKAMLADARRFQGALDTLPGVKAIRLNLLARSCTVEYDPAVIPQKAWPDLLAGVDSPEAGALIRIVAEKYAEIANA